MGLTASTFQGLHEAFGLGIVVGIGSSTHGADKPLVLENLPVSGRGVLGTAVRVVNAFRRRVAGAVRRRSGSTLLHRPRRCILTLVLKSSG
jgi:hypothetical protein